MAERQSTENDEDRGKMQRYKTQRLRDKRLRDKAQRMTKTEAKCRDIRPRD